MVRPYHLLDEFLKEAADLATWHPMCVVIGMHEYFRCLWPNDPYIPERKAVDHLEHIETVLSDSIRFLQAAKSIGSYFKSSGDLAESYNAVRAAAGHGEGETQAIYQRLWTRLADTQIASAATVVVQNIFANNGESLGAIRGKSVLDMGCGSGRFSLALAKLGAAKVVGIDLGKESLERARRLAEQQGVGNVVFTHGDVLDLPFDNESFDFVMCKGVLHHTGNLTRGLDEYFRVMKAGGRGYLYLYGSGGLFWTSRRRMREVMRLIPIDYAMNVLDLMGMPPRRYIFIDSWYVPIEEHVQRQWLEDEFQRRNVLAFSRADDRGRAEVGNMNGSPYAQLIWGDGDLRYFLSK